MIYVFVIETKERRKKEVRREEMRGKMHMHKLKQIYIVGFVDRHD